MNEEKEELKQQLEKLQKQLVLSNNQVSSTGCYWQHSGSPVSTPCVSEVLTLCHSPCTYLRIGAEGEQEGQRGVFSAACRCQSISFN